jgi:hypothetical protein
MLAILNDHNHFTKLGKEYFPFHCELCSKCAFLNLSYSILKIVYHVLNYSSFELSPSYRVQNKITTQRFEERIVARHQDKEKKIRHLS